MNDFDPSVPNLAPYLIRAVYDWCCDNGYTPHIALIIDDHTQIPRQFAEDAQVVLNIAPEATQNLVISNEALSFRTRFSGVAYDILIPVGNIIAIYAQENGVGLPLEPRLLDEEDELPTAPLEERAPEAPTDDEPPPEDGRPHLRRIK